MVDLKIKPMERRENVRSYVYRLLYDNIMSVYIPPGTVVSEQETSSHLRISRTPVREAFIHLSQDGLVEIFPQRGTFVAKINTALIEENRFMRITLERAIIRQACSHLTEETRARLEQSLQAQRRAMENRNSERFMALDNEMHGIIFAGCGKAYIWKVMMQANLDYQRARALAVLTEEEMNVVYTKHVSLLHHIFQHETEQALEDIDEHINHIRFDLAALKQAHPDYFT